MNRNMAIIVLVLAIGLGLTAVVLVNKWLTARASESVVEVKKSVPMARVVIATQEILPGTRLTASNLAFAEWPQSNVPKGAFDSLDAVKDRVAISKLAPGQPLMAAELASPGAGAGLVAIISPGMRAMAIRVDEVIGVGGFILPNTYVDVIGVQQTGNTNQKAVETLLKKIKVLAVAQETQNEDGKARLVRTVTLEVRPREAEKLALQVNEGPIHLVLRNPQEEEFAALPEPKVVARAGNPGPRAVSPRAPTFKVEMIQGDKQPEVYEFSSR